MSWLDGRERWVYPALAYALLAISATSAALLGVPAAPPEWPFPPWQSVPWPVLVLLAAVWLAAVPWLYPRRDRRRAFVISHYLVLLALAAALSFRSTAFVVFASIGYPLAIAMLPARLIMAGVTLTALVNVTTQSAPGARATLLAVIMRRRAAAGPGRAGTSPPSTTNAAAWSPACAPPWTRTPTSTPGCSTRPGGLYVLDERHRVAA